MAQDYAGAVRAGAMAASRLHRDLGIRDASDGAGGAIDVFAAIYQLDLPLMLRPLKGLMGAFLNDPCPGILIGTGWRMNIQRFTAMLHDYGIQVALDDVGGSRNLFSFDLLDTCNYVKLDRRWFSRLEKDAAYRSLISGLVQFCRARGIAVILEGVESRRHFSIAKTLGVDFVQGYLFRDAFVTVTV